MGNHDDNDAPGYETLEPILYDTPYGLYRHGNADVTGFGNYMVGLIDDARKPVWLLYMLDTHDGRRYEHKFYPDQIQWYRERRELFREVRASTPRLCSSSTFRWWIMKMFGPAARLWV